MPVTWTLSQKSYDQGLGPGLVYYHIKLVEHMA